MGSVWRDFHNRTCLMTERGEKEVRLLMLTAHGVFVYHVSKEQFKRDFAELVDYPPKQAARRMLNWSRYVGADDEALDELSKIIKINERERAMAKKNLPAAKMSEKASIHGKTPKGSKKAGEPKVKRETAAQLFRELIVEKGMTDTDEIFKKVVAKFPTTTKTAVGYYKWKLKKETKKAPGK